VPGAEDGVEPGAEDGVEPGAKDGVESDCRFVECWFWEFEPGLLPAAPVGFEVSLAGPIGFIGVVHVMTGEPGHAVHVFSVVVKPEGQPVGRV